MLPANPLEVACVAFFTEEGDCPLPENCRLALTANTDGWRGRPDGLQRAGWTTPPRVPDGSGVVPPVIQKHVACNEGT